MAGRVDRTNQKVKQFRDEHLQGTLLLGLEREKEEIVVPDRSGTGGAARWK